MSNFKTFKNYRDELKSLSRVVNKFDFDELALLLLADNCKGNFSLFDPGQPLSKQTRYAFIKFAIPQIYVKGHKQDIDKYSDLRLVNFIEVLFNLPESDSTVKTYDGKGNPWKAVTQPGIKNLLKLWNKATAAKAAAKAKQDKTNVKKATEMIAAK